MILLSYPEALRRSLVERTTRRTGSETAMNPQSTDTATLTTLRSLLLQLARHEDDLAAAEAAHTPYWSPYPSSVIGHRAAAAVLREQADQLVA